MQALTNRSKVVSNKKLSFIERLYLPAILNGLKITFKHIFKKKVTVSYPEVKRAACKIVVPAGTSIVFPSMVILGI